MADTGNAGAGQEPGQQGQQTGQEPAATDQSQGQQPAGSGQEPGQQQQAQQGTDDGLPDLSGITDPALRAWVVQQAKDAKDARAEAARFRVESRTAQDQVTQYQRQNETAEQKAEREAAEHQAEVDGLKAEVRNLRLGNQWTDAATKAKALDAQALLSLLGGPDKIELGDDGKATNMDALLTEAKTTYPWAFSRTAGADGPAGGGDGQQPTATPMNDWIRGRR
jgi:hypothetical protein